MNQATYHTISGHGLLDNYKVHYYFDKYTGAGSNTHVYSDGDSQYSGKIFSYSGGAHSSAALDLFTGDLGTGTFSGGINDVYDYIDINNHEDLFSGAFTFLISAQATSLQDLGESQKGPVSNNNILFSNLTGEMIVSRVYGTDTTSYEECTGTRYVGWEIGLNASNRLYCEAYKVFDPFTATYMGEQPPYPQNIWGVVYNEGLLKVGFYDIATEKFSFNFEDSVAINVNHLDSTDHDAPWTIGLGTNFDPDAKFTPQLTSNSGMLAGKINNFLYFNRGMENAVMSDVAKSLYSDLYEKTPPTSDSATGMTLFSLEGLDVSGLLFSGFQCSVTGYETGIVEFNEIREVTGNLTGAMTYYTLLSTRPHAISGTVGTYSALWATGDVPPGGDGVVPPSGITGFLTIAHQSGVETAISGCSGISISGLIFSSSGLEGGAINGFTGALTSSVSGISGEPTSLSRPDAFSYIGGALEYDRVVEKYNIGSFGTLNVGELNNLAKLGFATLNPGQGFFIKKSADPDSLSFYLNGVGREQGEITLRTDLVSEVFTEYGITYARTACGTIIALGSATDFEIESLFSNYTITSGDCFISGREIMEALVFPLSNTDILNIYDTGLNTGTVRSRAEVNSIPLDYQNTIQYAFGDWDIDSTGLVYNNIQAQIAATEISTCWVSGANVEITWPVSADFPPGCGGCPVLAEIYDTQLVGEEYWIYYRYLMGSGVAPNTYDITVERSESCFSALGGDQWVFFNGQKLVSGIDYYDHPTSGFTPSGYLTGVTGTYFTFPPVAGTTETTGTSLSFEASPFFPDSNVIFINGVRQDVTTQYVEHSSTRDLISGKETLKNYGEDVYNNYNIL